MTVEYAVLLEQDGTWQGEIHKQDQQNNYYFLISPRTHVAQGGYYIPISGKLKKLIFWVDNDGGQPGTVLYGALYKDSDGTLVATSTNSYSGSGNEEAVFNFNTAINSGVYKAAVYESGTPNAYRWQIHYLEGDITDNGYLEDKWSGSWRQFKTRDLYLKVEVQANNIAQKVRSIIIDQGKSDIDGEFEQSTCEIVFNNKGGEFFPENSSSPYYGAIAIKKTISVFVNVDSEGYKPLYIGFIKRIRPSFIFGQKTAYIHLVDAYHFLKEEDVSPGSQVAKKAHELMQAVFDAAAWDYPVDLEEDPIPLATVNWQNEDARDLVSTILEVGQHHGFVGNDGRFVFRNNQWLSNNSPKFTFDADVIGDQDTELNLEYDFKGIINRVRVKYPTDLWEENSDATSIAKYGQIDARIDNELMPTQQYADNVGEYIIASRKDEVPGINVFVPSRKDIYKNVGIGDPLRFIVADANLDEIFTIFGLRRRIIPPFEHDITMRCRKWVEPIPIASYYFYEPFTNYDDTKLPVLFRLPNVPHAGQTFSLPTTGKIQNATYRVRIWNVGAPVAVYCRATIWNTSGGVPTGSPIAYSNWVYCYSNFLYLGSTYQYLNFTTFTFSDVNLITLNSANTYIVAVEINSALFYASHLIGRDDNPYASGQAYQRHYTLGWQNGIFGANGDCYFKFKVLV